MKLRPAERSAILAGDHPPIIRPFHRGEGCPFAVGEVVVLRSERSMAGPVAVVSITIIGRKRTKAGAWRAVYSVRDDRGLYLARGPGYTRSAADSLDWQAPVEDEDTLRAYAAQGRLRSAERTEDRRRRERAIRDRLRIALTGLPPEGQVLLLASIEREIQRATIREAA